MSTTCYLTDIRPLSSSLTEGASLLSPERRQRVLGCRRPASALGYLGAGLLLRHVFGRAQGDIRFTDGGKPYLPGGPFFNLSHGGHYAVLAVDASPLGVDIERIRTFDRRVANRCFSPSELHWAQDSDDRLITLWTLKESVLKAHGTGLSFAALRAFSVQPALAGAVPGGLWNLHTQILDDHALSLATSGDGDFQLIRVPAADLLAPETIPQERDLP